MRRRVCHISTVHVANDVRIFYRECRSLVEAGYEVYLVIPAEASGEKDGVHIRAIRSARNRLLRMLFMPWVALRVALGTKADLYHYHDPELLPVGFVLRWLFGKRVVYDIHEAVPRQILGKQWLPRRSRSAMAFVYSLLERVLIPGQALILANEGWNPQTKRKAYLVRNYPKLNVHHTASIKPVSRRTNPPLLVYLGGISYDRGADTYLDLARALAERDRDFRMILIGNHDETYGRHLNRRIAESGLAERVTLTGRLDHREAMDYVADASIGLCLLRPIPNYTTCLATKILEYMMAGTPVLASNFDAWQPYVAGQGAGRTVDPCNPDAVVQACVGMLDNMPELDAMGQRGAEAIRAKFNWSSEFRELLRCYDELIDPPGQKRPTALREARTPGVRARC